MTEMKNKILIRFFLEEGLSQEDGEVEISWEPINFMIYSNLFQDMAYQAADEWLEENTLAKNIEYYVTFEHEVERDVYAITGEYFNPVHVDLIDPCVEENVERAYFKIRGRALSGHTPELSGGERDLFDAVLEIQAREFGF